MFGEESLYLFEVPPSSQIPSEKPITQNPSRLQIPVLREGADIEGRCAVTRAFEVFAQEGGLQRQEGYSQFPNFPCASRKSRRVALGASFISSKFVLFTLSESFLRNVEYLNFAVLGFISDATFQRHPSNNSLSMPPTYPMILDNVNDSH